MKNKSGLIISAAFIGPGTVTTASLAGAQSGMGLAWALLFSVVATCVLHDIVVRLSLATKMPLSTNILAAFSHPTVRRLVALLIFSAIGIGNAAYQSGNLTGAAVGLTNSLGGNAQYWSVVIGCVAALLLFSGSYKWIERIFTLLVLTMSLVFCATLWFAQPNWSELLRGFFTPQLNVESLSIVLALIGTTLVPYNLFLHASLIAQEQPNQIKPLSLAQQRKDSAIAIAIGGLISVVIMATAALAFHQTDTQINPATMGNQLAPILGDYASLFFAIGLFAAGITSAVAAPLAAGYAITSLLNWQKDLSASGFKVIAGTIIAIGTLFASIGSKPLSLIVLAQATNALLLPLVVAILLIVVASRTQISRFAIVLGWIIFAVVSSLALVKLIAVF